MLRLLLALTFCAMAADPGAQDVAGPVAPVVPVDAELEKVATGFRFTEGPAFGPGGSIYFSDIPNNRIHRFDPKTSKTAVHRESTGGANGLMFDAKGHLYACEGTNRRLTRQVDDVATPLATHFEGKRLNSPNDLVLDAAGGIYFTDPRYGKRDDMELDVEAVYYLDRVGKLHQIIDDLERPNGIVLSPDGKTLYVADNATRIIHAYPLTAPGELGERTDFATLDKDARGGPDGMTVDRAGNVYVAGQRAVTVFDKVGKLVGRIDVPGHATNCTFAGPGCHHLYITAGDSLYRIKLTTQGL